MSNMAVLSRLYPNLNIRRLGENNRTRSISATRIVPEPILPTATQKPAVVETPKPLPVVVTEPEVVQPAIAVEVPKPVEPVIETPVIVTPEVPKVAPKKTKRVTLPEPETIKPIRPSQIPNKGEKGLQKRYSEEQRREMYIQQLSKKSVRRAEAEVAKVQQILESCDHSDVKLKRLESQVKGQLRLISTAKFFTIAPIIEENASTIEDKSRTTETTHSNGNKNDKVEETA